MTSLLTGCGGGGGGGLKINAPAAPVAGSAFAPATKYQALCTVPRTGTDPYTHSAYPDKQGNTLSENNWLRSWTNQFYLWYNEVPDENPADYSTPAYFDLLKTTALTSSGAPKDKFHFTYKTADWEALSLNGVEAGYGFRWAMISKTPPRKLLIAYVEPNAPSEVTAASIRRGAEVTMIDGIDLVGTTDNTSIDALNAAISPSTIGEAHTFTVKDVGASSTRDVTLHSANVTTDPVPVASVINTGSGAVGYMQFNDHIATAESELISRINVFKQNSITDLVLDLRYNGGGLLDIASELAYMIAGAATMPGLTFENTQFNDKYPTTNPITGAVLSPTLFHSKTQGFSTTAGQELPTLNLSRVFVLTTANTCSASEALINGLRGINIEVIEIGATTCGKPYGFYPQDNCGTTYFSIEMRGVNAVGFGDYTDGFSPQNDSPAKGEKITGCAVADDFNHALGDANEALFAAALNYRNSSSCPAPSYNYAPSTISARQRSLEEVKEIKLSPARENRILR